MKQSANTTCDVAPETIIAYVCGDLPDEQSRQIAAHVRECESCERRVKDQEALGRGLADLMKREMPEEVVPRVPRASETHKLPSEVLTLDEIAGYLRITEEQLACLIDELPLFELGGELRARRERIEQWISERELAFQRNAMRSSFMNIRRAWMKGVA